MFFRLHELDRLVLRSKFSGIDHDVGCAIAPRELLQHPRQCDKNESVFDFDLNAFLPGDILVKVDRAAMAHGLETRAPFLDRDVAQFALSLPAALKVNGAQTKVLFKHALSRYWPPQLRARGKQGFGSPYEAWLQFREVQALSSRVFAPESPLRSLLPGASLKIVRGRPYEMWNLLTLGLWLERHVP